MLEGGSSYCQEGFCIFGPGKMASLMVNYDRLKPCHGRILPKWFTDWLKDPVLPEDHEDQDTVYCLCRKPHQGRFMMQYDWLFVYINLLKSQ